jgi:transcriptional regulator with PAS, ATPase and Fis domain
VNCAALSGSLLESELFGHEKGAFTGALGAKAGLFEAADGGTVFLDEVGELPEGTQAKLLRVIERGEVIRLGSVQTRTVDVRYVAATNRDVQQLIKEGRFRADLYFRLNGFSVTLPALRFRPREIVPFAQLFLRRAAHGRPFSLTQDAHAVLEAYPWPGNVRELKNVVERALVLAGPGGLIDLGHLQLADHRSAYVPSGEVRGPNDTVPPFMAGAPIPMHMSPPTGVPAAQTPYGQPHVAPHAPPPHVAYGLPHGYPANAPMPQPGYGPAPVAPLTANDLRAQRESWEKQQILTALEKTSGNQKEAAVLLGISRRTLINKIEAYGIARPRKKT